MGKWKTYAFIDVPGCSDIKLNVELSGEMISHQNPPMMIYSSHVAHWLFGGLGRHLEEVAKINEPEMGVSLPSKVNHCALVVMHPVRHSFTLLSLMAMLLGAEWLNKQKPWREPCFHEYYE